MDRRGIIGNVGWNSRVSQVPALRRSHRQRYSRYLLDAIPPMARERMVLDVADAFGTAGTSGWKALSGRINGNLTSVFLVISNKNQKTLFALSQEGTGHYDQMLKGTQCTGVGIDGANCRLGSAIENDQRVLTVIRE